MKLLIKWVVGPHGRILVLCDKDGKPFPCQKRSSFESDHEALPEFTVTFLIDNHQLKIEG